MTTDGFDIIDGREVPQRVVSSVEEMAGLHRGTVRVEAGILTLTGVLQGTLSLSPGTKAIISGLQQGTVHVRSGAQVTVSGSLAGTVSIDAGGELTIEPTGAVMGTLANMGVVVVRGTFGGARSGSGEFRVEGGIVKQPIVRDGIHYYE